MEGWEYLGGLGFHIDFGASMTQEISLWNKTRLASESQVIVTWEKRFILTFLLELAILQSLYRRRYRQRCCSRQPRFLQVTEAMNFFRVRGELPKDIDFKDKFCDSLSVKKIWELELGWLSLSGDERDDTEEQLNFDSDEVEEELSLLEAAERIRHGKDTTGWFFFWMHFPVMPRTAWRF